MRHPGASAEHLGSPFQRGRDHTGEEFWISGPRKDGGDRLCAERIEVEIDDDVRDEYWTQIRGRPSRAGESTANR